MKNLKNLQELALKELALRELFKRNKVYRECFKSFATHFFKEELGRPFVWNWHHQLIFDKLEELYNSTTQELLVINIHPNSGKTELITKLYNVWKMGNVKDYWAMVIGYSADLTKDFSVEAREYVSSNTYRAIFGDELDDKQKAKEYWRTNSGGRFYAVGVGGTITGKRGDMIIIDDPVNPKEITSMAQLRKVVDWFKRTVRSRRRVMVNDAGELIGRGKIVIVMQRLHEYDLCGSLFEDDADKFERGVYQKLVIPAIAKKDDEYRKEGEAMFPQFFDEEFLASEKESLTMDGDPHHYSAQYDQEPIDMANAKFKKEYFKYMEHAEIVKRNYPFGVIAIDPASGTKETADFRSIVVLTKDEQGFYYVLENKYGRWDAPEFQQIIFDVQATYGYKVVIETNHGGTFLIDNIETKQKEDSQFFQLEGVNNTGNKQERILNTLQPLYKAGRVIHSDKLKRDELENQLLFFPKMKHDDCPDSLELGVKHIGIAGGVNHTSNVSYFESNITSNAWN